MPHQQPFIKVGDRVRWIVGMYSLPSHVKLGTVTEYHAGFPGIQAKSGAWLVEPVEDFASVKWDDGSAFGIEFSNEGKRWLRVGESPNLFELYNTQYSLKQLQEMAKTAGLSPSGLKQDLINRLAQKGMLK